MNRKDNFLLWTDTKRSRYFLIPEKQKLARGSFVIHTLTGKQKKVTQIAIAPFEISETDAKNYIQTEINQGMQQAKTTFSHLISSSTQTSEEVASVPNVICSLLGITPEELENNPEAAQTAFANLYSDLKEFLGASSDKNPAQVETTRSRVRSLRETIQAQALNINIEELPKNLQPKVEEYLQEILTQLENLTTQIDTDKDGQSIDEVIESLTKDFLVKEEKRLAEQRKQNYKQSAQEAIAKSFQSRGLRSFAGGDFNIKI
jgi:hypothetical protein